jgi:hypothetical protein
MSGRGIPGVPAAVLDAVVEAVAVRLRPQLEAVAEQVLDLQYRVANVRRPTGASGREEQISCSCGAPLGRRELDTGRIRARCKLFAVYVALGEGGSFSMVCPRCAGMWHAPA